ncbi:Nodulation protein G [Geodia barretti]|uniref:3-oxoacyl-[acyl-carrier-protein] reductase n=1 Tax=Geodia barretti TaxID=519541 RepID=A0AA35TK06_GEOBA|nr:Nodulation protein G [Geodia barretti]
MDFGLQDTVVLVVDSHLAIATATATALAKEGAILSLTAPDNYRMRHVEMALARKHIPQDRFRAVIADLDREQDIHRLVRATLHRQGNIGVMVTTVQDQGNSPASELEDEQIEPALARNFMSAVHLTREVLPHMRRYGMGRIINLVPFSAMEVSPRNTLSSLSLAPVLAYFKGLASELAPNNITVNNVIYAGVDSDEIEDRARSQDYQSTDDVADEQACAEAKLEEISEAPMKRMGTPKEIGDIVCMIASAQASYLTGANIIVDGGIHHNYA